MKSCKSLFFITPLIWAGQASPADEVVVHAARNEHPIKPLFAAYTRATDIPVKFTSDQAAPRMTSLKVERRDTPANLFMAVDARTHPEIDHVVAFRP